MTSVPLEQTITSNGTFTFNPADYSADGFSSVTIIVNVPQTVTTGYLLKYIYGVDRNSRNFSSLTSSWQNNTTVSISGDFNHRLTGSYMYYDATTRRINIVSTGTTGTVSITFGPNEYYIRQEAFYAATFAPWSISLYDVNDVSVASLGTLSMGSYVTIPENIVVNL